MEEARYAIALSVLRGVSLTAGLELLRRYGSASAAYAQREEWEQTLGRPVGDWDKALQRADEELEFCQKGNLTVLTMADPDYPVRLRDCPDAPQVLYYRGTADLNARYAVAVVGTRHITEYGKEMCAALCRDLHDLRPDCLVVSGLAYGVDIHTHRACLAEGLPTVGVLAHGLDRIYPSLHRDTAAQMTTSGGLLTEYVSGTIPDRGNFLRRNRIVAGLTDATIVVESAGHGGALVTARLAADYNREVGAFPGRASDPCSEGCNALIRSHKAHLVTSAADVADILGWQCDAQRPKAVQGELFPELDERSRTIRDALRGSDGESVGSLSQRLGMPVGDVSGALFEMEMTGVVKLLPGGRYKLMG